MDYQNYSAGPTTDLFAQEAVYAGFWDRFFAALLDGLILGVVATAARYFLGYYEGFFLGIAINWLYYALQESGDQQATLGKRALGIRVIDESGGKISFAQASGRYFGKYVSTVILLIGYLMMLWDDKKQTLHDKMAGTLVVKG